MNVGQFAEATAVVTGGESGIGAACVETLVDEGAKVALTFHSDRAAANTVVARCGGPANALAMQTDVTDEAAVMAAFAIQGPFGSKGLCALVSVAALNPDGTVALFSNDGDWVTAEAEGANVVSTAPIVVQGGLSAAAAVQVDGHNRSSIDPDGFSGGYATWSGTSFAAPVLAGRFLAQLANVNAPADEATRLAIVKKLLR